jgi:hypothetical protein
MSAFAPVFDASRLFSISTYSRLSSLDKPRAFIKIANMKKHLRKALAAISAAFCLLLLILWPVSYSNWISLQLTLNPQSWLTEIAVDEGQVTGGYLSGWPLPANPRFASFAAPRLTPAWMHYGD